MVSKERRLAPYQQLVDGLLLPVRVGGHPALDFCNTCAGRRDGGVPAVEYLASHEHLAVFAREAGLVDGAACSRALALARRRGEDASAVLADAIALREALARVCVSGGRSADRALVAASVEQAARAAEFDLPAAATAGWSLPERLDLPLLAVARSAGELLAAEDAGPVRVCPGRDCGWLFLDRTGRRRWCSMASCGNREKARRHAARARAAARG